MRYGKLDFDERLFWTHELRCLGKREKKKLPRDPYFRVMEGEKTDGMSCTNRVVSDERFPSLSRFGKHMKRRGGWRGWGGGVGEDYL